MLTRKVQEGIKSIFPTLCSLEDKGNNMELQNGRNLEKMQKRANRLLQTQGLTTGILSSTHNQSEWKERGI